MLLGEVSERTSVFWLELSEEPWYQAFELCYLPQEMLKILQLEKLTAQ
jgi:hypothetical protein